MGIQIVGCKTESSSKITDSSLDFDMDGVPDQIDLDDDNDGIPDLIETSADIDGDNIPNYLDRDSDGDGIPDLIEATGVDKDGDGILDVWDEWEDENHDGLNDEYENEPLVVKSFYGGSIHWKSMHQFGVASPDQDNDGIPNFWDTDSDNDGISDSVEAGTVFSNSQIVDANGDGFDDRLVGNIYTQGDFEGRSGHPEFVSQELKQYESVMPDGSFGKLNGFSDIDDNGNGVPDFWEKNLDTIKH
ncbi:MAG: hypothetical protein GC192_01940 [Bacteroidetes bacterium]|nr:hypothetical protein [Bacteroidota bacterium]